MSFSEGYLSNILVFCPFLKKLGFLREGSKIEFRPPKNGVKTLV